MHLITAQFQTRDEADDAVRRLLERGVPRTCIHVRESSAQAAGEPAAGPSLGWGVPVEATESLIEAHDGEVAAVPSRPSVVVTVDPMGDPNKEAASREVFGYLA